MAAGYKRIDSFGMTVDVPIAAVVDTGKDSNERELMALQVEKFPACRFYCSMSLTTRPLPTDSTFAAWVHALTIAKSSDPDAEDYTPSILDSAAVNGAPSYFVEHYCGDCTDRALYVLQDRQIVTLRWNVDDRESKQADAALLAVARTLRRRVDASR